jgi:hypothetical protein
MKLYALGLSYGRKREKNNVYFEKSKSRKEFYRMMSVRDLRICFSDGSFSLMQSVTTVIVNILVKGERLHAST